MRELGIVCADLDSALDELRADGFRLDVIYPADAPHSARLSRGAERVHLTTQAGAAAPPPTLPDFRPEFLLGKAAAGGVQGRAGMLYRDLIPGRLGGRYIASHITVPEGGPVADWVHHHRIAFQLIAVRRGWVRVVYEDQGNPFVMHAGDMVLQPPGIRHRVLESSSGLEVIEIGCPAVHETFADHNLALPNGAEPSRTFSGQRFARHIAAEAPWTPFSGGEAQETEIADATDGLAEARVVRSSGDARIAVSPHAGELVFGFVLEGSARLEHGEGADLAAADAFVIPPGEAWAIGGPSPDFRLLHVTSGVPPRELP